MKSPKDMRIIQIDITNACIHQCSNCTRFCGHHAKPFFMDFETFKRAVDSLEGYVGTVSLMGGEPTLHPDFERMARYLASKYPPKEDNQMFRPQVNFMDSIHDLELQYTFAHDSGLGPRRTVNGPGLWSAMGEGYKRHYEVIQDCIQYQALDDHINVMYHQPSLLTRKELGISDEQWIPLRDACWVQNLWSATITPKGAFFCEEAGALDMLFDGPGGWPIEPGWWKRTPEEFGDQLRWCELCGMACETFMRDANEEVDDVSPAMYERLKRINSPKVKRGKINVLKIEDGKIAAESQAAGRKSSQAGMPYAESYNTRFNAEKTSLFSNRINGLFICRTQAELVCALKNAEGVDQACILAVPLLAEGVPEEGHTVFLNAEEVNLGQALYRIFREGNYSDFLLVTEGEVRLDKGLRERLKRLALNPGTLHIKKLDGGGNGYFSTVGRGTAALLNGTASSVRELGRDRLLRLNTLSELEGLWKPEKVVPYGPESERWVLSSEIHPGKRYVVYGAGADGRDAVLKIEKSGAEIVTVVDSNEARWGESFCESYTIQSPDEALTKADTFDYIMIATSSYHQQVKALLLERGFSEEKLVMF